MKSMNATPVGAPIGLWVLERYKEARVPDLACF